MSAPNKKKVRVWLTWTLNPSLISHKLLVIKLIWKLFVCVCVSEDSCVFGVVLTWSLALSMNLTSDPCTGFLQVKESKEKEKLERRLLEELLKMFMDSESFYYSLTYDLTNSVQRQSTGESDGRPLWQKVQLTVQSSVGSRNTVCSPFIGHRRNGSWTDSFPPLFLGWRPVFLE